MSEEINLDNMIYSLAHRYKNASVEDLYQAGYVGLLKAKKGFNSDVGTKFSTYAYPFIEGEIKAYLRSDTELKLSRDLSYLIKQIDYVKSFLTQELMRDPTQSELASYLGISEYELTEAQNASTIVKRLEDKIDCDGEITLADTISIKENTSKEELILLRSELEKLAIEEQTLIGLRYMEDKTQGEIASILGMSQVQVSRQEKHVLEKLKNSLH